MLDLVSEPLQVMLGAASQPLQVMLGAVFQPLWYMLKKICQPLRVMLTLLKRLSIQNIIPSFLVSFVREITLLINALLLRRCEEFGFMVIPFLNILESLNSQPLNEVGPSHPAYVVHAGGKISSSAGHVERKQSATASHADTIEKTGCSKHHLVTSWS